MKKNGGINMDTPVIREDQQIIMYWARQKKEKAFVNISFIISALVSSKPHKPWADDMLYNEARAVYHKYNSFNKDNILRALIFDNYRLEHDVETGDIVTDGKHVGYATVDYKERTAMLYCEKERKDDAYIVSLDLDTLYRVGKKGSK